MTTQVARIALTRLSDVARPLRLSYTGEVLRVRGTQLRPERQFAQVGAELIGSDSAAADIEIIAIAIESLREIGVPDLSVDLTIPPLVPALMTAVDVSDQENTALRDALNRKDTGAVRKLGGAQTEALCGLMDATGLADSALVELASLTLPEEPARELQRLRTVVEGLGQRVPDLRITVDPAENRGLEYHTGVAFTFFSRGERGEIGAGGRYVAAMNGDTGNDNGEPATGFTLFVDTILRVLPDPPSATRLYVPVGAEAFGLAALRQDGWVTVAGVETVSDNAAEAKRLGCTHIWSSEGPVAVEEGNNA
jgi:ATP phosphoribosyltransferase regulatory subunit